MSQFISPNQRGSSKLFGAPNRQGYLRSHSFESNNNNNGFNNDYSYLTAATSTTAVPVKKETKKQLTSADLRSPVLAPLVDTATTPPSPTVTSTSYNHSYNHDCLDAAPATTTTNYNQSYLSNRQYQLSTTAPVPPTTTCYNQRCFSSRYNSNQGCFSKAPAQTSASATSYDQSYFGKQNNNTAQDFLGATQTQPPLDPWANDHHYTHNHREDDGLFDFLGPASAEKELEAYYHHPQVNTTLLYGHSTFRYPYPRVYRKQKMYPYNDQRSYHQNYHQEHHPYTSLNDTLATSANNATVGFNNLTDTTNNNNNHNRTNIAATTQLTPTQEHWINMWTTGVQGHSSSYDANNHNQEHWINMWKKGIRGHLSSSNDTNNKNDTTDQPQDQSMFAHEYYTPPPPVVSSSKESFSAGSSSKSKQQKQQQKQPDVMNDNMIFGVDNNNLISSSQQHHYNNEKRSNAGCSSQQRTWSNVVGEDHSSKTFMDQQPKPTSTTTASLVLEQQQTQPQLQAPLKPTRAINSATAVVMPGSSSLSLSITNDNHYEQDEDVKRSQPRRASTSAHNTNHNNNNGKHNYHMINNNATKRLSDSLSYNAASINNPPATSKYYPVLMISNIPWNISIKEIENFLSLDPQEKDRQYIHIMLEKSTGKTQKEAFIEFDSVAAFEKTTKKLKRNPTLKGRKVNVYPSTPEHLFRKIFPRWQGVFINGKPAIMDDDDESQQDDENDQDDSLNQQQQRYPDIVPPFIVEGFEYESLLNICRNYKMRYSRKCPERPFENYISMMIKFPWSTPEIITTMQRDHLYEYYKLATATLRFHLNKPYHQINNTLMMRMVRTALVCPGLTVNQKKGILTSSEIPCPEDLTHYLESPLDEQSSSQ